MPDVLTVAAIIGVALIFDFLNGVHDAANSIATVVSTRVLSPRTAVAWAAFFNFIAYLVFPLAVAKTIGKGVVEPVAITMPVVTAGLIGAIVWNILTWWAGIPSSSSHALVGGFAGAAIAFHGIAAVKTASLLTIGAFIIIAPVMGLLLGFGLMVATYWTVRRWAPARVSRVFHRLQIVSAAAYSLGHGGNDAQKTMGIIFAVLLAAGPATQEAFGFHASMHEPPLWVVLACHAAMGLGTLLGGWRIVKTMGQKICHLQPVHGFSAETAGAAMLYGATALGIPVSTTHTITGAILGVGSTRGLHAVKWGVATRVVWAWVLTIPAAALVAAATWWLFQALGWR
jgi:PiT family inorganic phosphate transporter